MILAFDLDDTLIDTFSVLLASCNQTYGENFQKEEFVSHNFASVWKITGEQWKIRFCDFDQTKAARDIPILPGAQKMIAHLAQYYYLHIVTSRPVEVAKQTRKLVLRYFPDMFSGIHFCTKDWGSTHICSKNEMCASLGAIALIDDHPKHVGLCVEAGLKVCVFDQPWNQPHHYPETNGSMARIFEWNDEATKKIKLLTTVQT